jgi:cobalamin 5'-phosphate synthase/cobalamin synthase
MPRFLAALAFLTRVPVYIVFDARDVGRSTLFFPLVGAGIGLFQWGLFLVLEGRLPALIAAVLVVSFSAWVTRGIHFDGLADFSDGLAGGGTKERALEIMRDPCVGAFGALALVLVVAVKIAAISALSVSVSVSVSVPMGLVLAPALARWASVPLSLALPNARRDGGLGSALTEHVGWVEVLGASVLALGLVFALAPRAGLSAVVAVAAVSVVVGAIARRRLGGVTGDVLGANVELSEAAALVAAVAVAR